MSPRFCLTAHCVYAELWDTFTADGASEQEVLRVAAAAEATTRHPVADALLNAAEQRGARGSLGNAIGLRVRRMQACSCAAHRVAVQLKRRVPMPWWL